MRAAAALFSTAAAAAAAAPPHLIILLSDDLGYSNVGFHNDLCHTPALDSLKAEGIELMRHYAYKFCSPSRSSLLSGRLPVHVNERNKITEAPLAGVPPGMTLLPAQLRGKGYRTHHIGKWHAGFASRSKNIPVARGFDTSFGYFHGAEDHYQQTAGGNIACPREKGAYKYTDLWLNDGPATGVNGTDYSMHLYRDRALRLIADHPLPDPLFLYVAFANNHAPLQVPDGYMSSYPAAGATKGERAWRIYQGMITAVDTAVANITAALRGRGMWDASLVLWTSDNGGPLHSANNYPLRGGKTSEWEGGFRVPGVVAGGWVPAARRGAAWAGVAHFADWYATFLAAAGLPAGDPAAAAAGLPGVDGHDLSAALLGGGASPWAGEAILLSSHAADPVINPLNTTVLLLDDWKLITGIATLAYWQGPQFPNASAAPGAAKSLHDCGAPPSGTGCLFDVAADPGEHDDRAAAMPEKAQALWELTQAEVAKVYNPDRGDPGLEPCAAADAAGGYWAPYLP